MAKNFRDWAEEAVEQMWFPLDRKKVRQELLDHMEDARGAWLERGLTEEEARQEALTAMGDAKATGKLLNKAHRPVLGWLWFASKWVSIIMVVILVFQFWSSSYEGNLILGIKKLWQQACMETPCEYAAWGDIPVEGGLCMEEGDYTLQLDHGQTGIAAAEQSDGYWCRVILGFQVSTRQWDQIFPKGLHNIVVEMPDGTAFSEKDRTRGAETCLIRLNYEDSGLPAWNVHLGAEYYTDTPPEWIRFYVPNTNIDFKVWMSGEVAA